MSIPPTPPSTAPARGLGFRGRVTRGMRSTRGRTQPPGGQQGSPAPPGGGTPAPPGGGTSAPPGGGTSAPPGGGTSNPPPDPNNDARTGEKRGPSSPAPRDVDAAKKARTEADSIPAQKLTLKKPKSYHLSKAEIAGDEKSTKLALETHIRALWMLPSQNKVPPTPSKAVITVFQSRFSDKSAIATSVRDTLSDNAKKIDGARDLVSNFRNDLPHESTSIISGNIRRIPEDQLIYIHSVVASLGLKAWNPDVLSTDPNSMYNILHEQLAIQTFQHLVAAHGYAHMGINHSKIKLSLLQRFYRSFVYGRMRDLARRELKSPGGVQRDTAATNMYKRRSELGNSRRETLKAHGFNPRVLALAQETDAHSDDELRASPIPAQAGVASTSAAASTAVIYTIRRKPGRSAKVKKFFRLIDVARAQSNLRLKAKYRRTERQREDPVFAVDSKLTAMPEYAPIDWFDPDVWNSFTVQERVDYVANGIKVALPLEKHCDTLEKCAQWKNLPEKEFMEKYGNEVLEQYHMPTEEEKEQVRQYDAGEEEEEAIDPMEED